MKRIQILFKQNRFFGKMQTLKIPSIVEGNCTDGLGAIEEDYRGAHSVRMCEMICDLSTNPFSFIKGLL